jgi:hypothetical protein
VEVLLAEGMAGEGIFQNLQSKFVRVTMNVIKISS